MAPIFLADHDHTPSHPSTRSHQVEPSPYMPRTTSDPALDSPLLRSSPTVSRTVAILLPHAHQHQPAIRKRFAEAGLEIIDEYDWDAEPDVLERDLALDGRLARAFMDELEDENQPGAGERNRKPTHLWLLERRRVIEVMQALVVSIPP